VELVVALTAVLVLVVVVEVCAEEILTKAVKTAKRTFLCILLVVPDFQSTVSLGAVTAVELERGS